MTDGASPRPTQKFDPRELLGLVAMTGRERPTCRMPKLELAKLIHDTTLDRAVAVPPTPAAAEDRRGHVLGLSMPALSSLLAITVALGLQSCV